MGNSKTTTKKCDSKSCQHCSGKCHKCNNIFSVCFLTAVLTAVLVALLFTISFTVAFRYEAKHRYGYRFNGQFAKELEASKDGEMLSIGAGAVIDFYESEQTGFLYISSEECLGCESFESRLISVANELDVLPNIYHYKYSDSDPSVYDDYASEITRNGEESPVLLYVRDGRIYDRLDEVNGGTGIYNFLAKYK